MGSTHEENQLKVLDVLIDAGGTWTAGDGRVLISLTQAVFPEEEVATSGAAAYRYKQISVAVLALEQMELVHVERKFRDEPEKANVIEAIRLT